MKEFRILFHVGFLKLSKYVEASLVNILSSVIVIVVQFFVWKMILANNDVQYEFTEMFSYILYSQAIACFYPSTLGSQLSGLIDSGNISYALLKPMPLVKQLIYENLGTSAYRCLFISVPVLAVGLFAGKFHLCAYHIGFFCISLIFSYIIYVCIDILFGILQFYTHSSWGIKSLKYAVITLFSGKMLPLSFYPKWSTDLIAYLPFRFLFDYPLEIIIGKNEFWYLLLVEAVWAGVLSLLAGLAYKISVRHIIIFGG